MISVAGVNFGQKFQMKPSYSYDRLKTSPADVTSAFAPDLLLRGRKPEHHNWFREDLMDLVNAFFNLHQIMYSFWT